MHTAEDSQIERAESKARAGASVAREAAEAIARGDYATAAERLEKAHTKLAGAEYYLDRQACSCTMLGRWRLSTGGCEVHP